MSISNLQQKVDAIDDEQNDLRGSQEDLKERVMCLDKRTLLIESKVNNIDRKVDTLLQWMGWFFKTVFGFVIALVLGYLATEFGIVVG